MPLPESTDSYADRALAAQESAGGHLPLPADGLTTWPSFPFDGDLRARVLQPPVDVENARMGDDPETCWCRDPAADAGWPILWSDGRCHIGRWGDGGAHGHVWFIARPARMPQLRGTFMALWDDILPPLPADVRAANDAAVVARVAAAYGGVVHG